MIGRERQGGHIRSRNRVLDEGETFGLTRENAGTGGSVLRQIGARGFLSIAARHLGLGARAHGCNILLTLAWVKDFKSDLFDDLGQVQTQRRGQCLQCLVPILPDGFSPSQTVVAWTRWAWSTPVLIPSQLVELSELNQMFNCGKRLELPWYTRCHWVLTTVIIR